MRKITFEEVQQYILENDINKDCTLLSTKEEYKNSRTKMLFICNCCGKTYKRNFTDVKRNSSFKCAVCAQGRRLTIEEVKDFIAKNDTQHECELLSTNYTNSRTLLDFKCNCCGETFQRSYEQVRTKHFACYSCLKKRQGGKNILSIQKVKDFIDEYDTEHSCTLLSTTYVNQSVPLLFRCNCCGKEFERTYQTMRSKHAFKCFRCAHDLPLEPTSEKYYALISYFRSKTHLWKKNFLQSHSECDITGEKTNLEIHHLINFSTILKQASLNTGIPLDYKPADFKNFGYSLDTLTNEFLKLHNEVPAVLLSKKYHQLFHKTYGYKNNTPEQYYEFKERYNKGEFN